MSFTSYGRNARDELRHSYYYNETLII
jgi:hypothetical protein